MRAFLLFILLFVEALAYGQGFNKRYDAFGWGFYQQAFNIEVDIDGFVVIGVTEDYDTISPGSYFFHASVLFERFDHSGAKLMEKRTWRALHNTVVGWANCCDTIAGGGYVVGGASEDTTGYDEVFLIRFDAAGDTLWTKIFGDISGENWWIGYQVKYIPENGFAIVGGTGDNELSGNADGFIIRTDSIGNELWRRTYGWTSTFWDGFISVDIAAAGHLFTGGTRNFSDGTTDRWVQRVDGLGDVQWSQHWGGAFSEGAAAITTLSDGHVAVFSGMSYAPTYGAMRPYMAKLDSSNGEIIWEHEFGSILANHLFMSGKECANGNLIATGFSFPSQDEYNGILVHTTESGDSLWMFNYFYQDSLMLAGRGQFFDVAPAPDGGFIAVGLVRNAAGIPYPTGYSQDTWVVKVDGNGCIVPGCNSVGISEQATNLLDAIAIFPNPTTGPVTVRLTLPPSVANEPLELSVVGMDGRVVHQQRLMGNGEHTLALYGLSAGVYHVHIATKGKWLTGGKLVVE